MNDLDICKRIADIKGVKVALNSESHPTHLIAIINGVRHSVFRPTKDKALCFDFMIEYGIMVEQYIGKYIAYYAANVEVNEGSGIEMLKYQSDSVADTPELAICLAIIEAHKDKTNDSN